MQLLATKTSLLFRSLDKSTKQELKEGAHDASNHFQTKYLFSRLTSFWNYNIVTKWSSSSRCSTASSTRSSSRSSCQVPPPPPNWHIQIHLLRNQSTQICRYFRVVKIAVNYYMVFREDKDKEGIVLNVKIHLCIYFSQQTLLRIQKFYKSIK